MTKRKKVVALAVFLGVLLSISMHFSKLYAIDQYFDARKIEIGRLYPVPNKNLYWSLLDLEISAALHDDWEFGLYYPALSAGQIAASDIFIESSTANSNAYVVSAIIAVSSISETDSGVEEENYRIPINFLKIGSRENPESFLTPVTPCAFITDSGQCTGTEIYTEPGTQTLLRLVYFLNDEISAENGYLFTNVIATQTASIGIRLKSYITE